MQLKTTDFAPGAATWRTERNILVVFDSGQFVQSYENMSHPQNQKHITHCNAVRGQIHGNR